jgi:hypothetical protein
MQKFSPATASESQSPTLERLLDQRRAVVTERERGRAESELSRATGMAQELERQVEQANAATARASHRPELQRTRASGSRRKKTGLVVDAADHPRDQSSTLLVEVMQELDRVKRELRQLQREVKSAREAEAEAEGVAETPTPRATSPGPPPLDGAEGEAGEGNEERGPGIMELAVAGGFRKQGVQDTRARALVLRRDRSLGASDPDERFATASSSDVGLESADTAAAVPATAHAVVDAETAPTAARQAAEAELEEPMKEEGARAFAGSVERTRGETAEEIDRLAEQEVRASAQVSQLNARLVTARSRLDAATAVDERAEAVLAELSAALRRLGEETEAAEKERALTELDSQSVTEDADAVGAEIAAVEQRVRESIKELEAARASEAAATARLRAAVEDAALAGTAPQASGGNVTVARFEYEYLAARPEVVRALAEKKAAAAEAWAEALRAGEKEIAMRVEMVEREVAETKAGEADATDSPSEEEREPRRVGVQQRAQTRRRPAPREGVEPETSRTTGTPSSSSVVVRKQRSPLVSRKTRTVASKYLKLVTGKCGG